MANRNDPAVVGLTPVTTRELLELLTILDNEFEPALSARIHLVEYAAKMAAKATLVSARQDGQLVGIAAVYCNDLSDRIAYVTYLGILPSLRCNGLGTKLMTQVMGAAHAQGMQWVELQTDAGRDASLRFYLRLGFEVISKSVRYGGFAAFRLRARLCANPSTQVT